MKTMNLSVNDYNGPCLVNQMYLRLDIRLFDFTEDQFLTCAQTIESFIKRRFGAAFVIRYEDMQGRSANKKEFRRVIEDELENSEQDGSRRCAISFQGFLKTEDMNKQADISKAWINARRSNEFWYSAYSADDNSHRIEFPILPDASMLDDVKTRCDYYRSIAEYSQTDKQWLSSLFSYDLQGLITATFKVDAAGNRQAMGDISLCFSCYMLDDSVEETYFALRKLALATDTIMPFVNASIGFGASFESSYDLCSQPVDYPPDHDRYDFAKEYGNLLGWFNLIPLSRDKQLPSDYPHILRKEHTESGSAVYELLGAITPYRAKDLLQIRKFFSPILLPMKKETIYYLHTAPHIAPVEADEICIEKHPYTGEYYPVYLRK